MDPNKFELEWQLPNAKDCFIGYSKLIPKGEKDAITAKKYKWKNLQLSFRRKQAK